MFPSVRVRLFSLVFLNGILFLTIVSFSLYHVRKIGQQFEAVRRLTSLSEGLSGLQRRIAETLIVHEGFVSGNPAGETQFLVLTDGAEQGSLALLELTDSDDLKRRIEGLRGGLLKLKEITVDWKAKGLSPRTEMAKTAFTLTESIAGLVEETSGRLEKKRDETARNVQFVIWATVSAALVLLGLMVTVSLRSGRQISRPLIQLRDAAEGIRRGIFDLPKFHASFDEIGTLTAAFEEMVVDLTKARRETEKALSSLRKSEGESREVARKEHEKAAALEVLYRKLELAQTASLNIMEDLDRQRQVVEEREKQLRETQSQLIQAEKMTTVGTLASGVAHEISNPLQAVTGNIEIMELTLKEDPISKEEILEILQETKHAVEKAKEIIQGLLRFARPTPQGSSAESVSIRDALLEALSLTHNDLAKEGIRVDLQVPPDLPPVSGSSRELMQVFVNLITNAVRAMDGAREKRLTVTADLTDKRLQISFKDTGVGIPEENLSRIFEPFFTTSYKQAEGRMKGTGLGLSICHRIIEGHKGEIRVASRKNEGATFTVLLPVSR